MERSEIQESVVSPDSALLHLGYGVDRSGSEAAVYCQHLTSDVVRIRAGKEDKRWSDSFRFSPFGLTEGRSRLAEVLAAKGKQCLGHACFGSLIFAVKDSICSGVSRQVWQIIGNLRDPKRCAGRDGAG